MTSKRQQRAQERFERAKEATQRAAGADEAEKEQLRKKMESGKTKPPAKLSRREMALARRMDDDYRGSVKSKKRFFGK